MTPTIRLGRLFGIDISCNWSLLVVFALVAWSLATSIPAAVPGRPSVEYVAAGIAGAVVFYLSLLAHELSHSIVARRLGVNVKGITLWLFGGVSQLEGEPRTARAEAALTAVGPLTSLVLAGLFYGAAALLLRGPGVTVIGDLTVWLAYINGALALFNLIPAFPLDGGRLLSSLLWWRSGSRRRAVHQAVRIGRWFAYAMIAFGLVEFLLGQALNGLWIVFLGWFLLSAAAAEESGSEIEELLGRVPVSAAMSAPVVTLPDWLTVEQLLQSEAPRHHFSTYPVHAVGGAVTGVVRLPEVVRRGAAGELGKRLSEVAHPASEIPRAQPAENLGGVLKRVGPRLGLRILVYEGEQLVGIVSPADVARVLTVQGALRGDRD